MARFPASGLVQVQSRSLKPWGLYVLLPSIQGTGVFVRMLHHGSADALRVSQKALPAEGTWGLVMWPHGDSRNGIWMGSVYTQMNDALPNTDLDMDYEAHPSGAWTSLDGSGNATLGLPDGSALTTNPSGATPPPRNVVQANQQQVSQAFPQGQRQTGTPAPVGMSMKFSSGAMVTISPTGDVVVQAAPGKDVSIISDTGVAITAPITTVTGNLLVTGDVTWHAGLGTAITAAAHTHSGGNGGVGQTGVPTTGT